MISEDNFNTCVLEEDKGKVEEAKAEVPPAVSFDEPQLSNLVKSEVVEPIAMHKQASSESYTEESTIADLQRDNFSISITQAKIVQDKQGGSYFSYLSSNSYAVFQIETVSSLPVYLSDKKVHTVLRRFSDFEFLLKTLQEKEDLAKVILPTLPEKRIYGNLDEQFIEERRVRLEGFLRVLITSGNRIKTDDDLRAFLTLSDDNFNEYRKNPNTYVDKMKSLYNALPSVPIKEITS